MALEAAARPGSCRRHMKNFNLHNVHLLSLQQQKCISSCPKADHTAIPSNIAYLANHIDLQFKSGIIVQSAYATAAWT